ncbi:MAG: hydroxyisourate hydrolase [Bacteroidota bacterium]
MSQITTHVLDTSLGKPAAGIDISLHRHQSKGWEIIAKGTTNADGRIADLLANDIVLPIGMYKLKFETAAYFTAAGIKAFYPVVEIIFELTTSDHYHVPLLLNPFGYSTYRGS